MNWRAAHSLGRSSRLGGVIRRVACAVQGFGLESARDVDRQRNRGLGELSLQGGGVVVRAAGGVLARRASEGSGREGYGNPSTLFGRGDGR
jgi:hypothetical protein